MAERLGLGGDLREGRLRTTLLLGVILFIVMAWVYRRVVKRDRTPFFYVPPTPSQDVKVTRDSFRSCLNASITLRVECTKLKNVTADR